MLLFFLQSKMAKPCARQGHVGSSLANSDDLLSAEIAFKSYEDLFSVIT